MISVSYFFLIIFVVASTTLLLPFADASAGPSVCLLANATPVAFSGDNNNSGFPVPPGFYAPGLASNDTTYYICPPTSACLSKRVSDEAFCEPQGTKDVAVCKPGFYCPTFQQQISCPKGYFCPAGSTGPYKCGALAYCPAESSRQIDYGSLFSLFFVFGIFGAILLIASRIIDGQQQQQQQHSSTLEKNNNSAALKVIRDAVLRRRTTTSFTGNGQINAGEQLCISFENISVSVSVPKSEREAAAAAAAAANNSASSATVAKIVEINDDDDAELGNIVLGDHHHSAAKSKTAAAPALNYNPVAFNDKGEKILLHPISGKIRSGRVTAVMGASGSGKTVFAGRLLQRFDTNWITSGSVRTFTNTTTIDEKSFRGLCSFVPQDDVLHYGETVHQNLFFTSEACLPSSWSSEQKNALRSAVIESLRLTQYADTRIGLPGDQDESGSGGLSGGTRKRVSIAQEIACAPQALVLDEPTTGLDAFVAQSVMELVASLAHEADVAVLAILHTPRVEIFRMIDDIILLAPGGRQVYLGPREHVIDYLKECVIAPRVSAAALGESKITLNKGNPADIMIDIISTFPQECVDAWIETRGGAEFFAKKKEAETKSATTANKNTTIPVENLQKIQNDLSQLAPSSATTDQDLKESSPPAYSSSSSDDRPGFFKIVYLRFMRRVLNYASDWKTLLFDVAFAAGTAAIMSTVAVGEKWGGTLRGNFALLSPKLNFFLVFNIAIFLCFGIGTVASPTSPIRSYGLQKLQLVREFRSGGSQLAVLVGYSLAEMIGCFVISFLYATVAYLMIQPTVAFGPFMSIVYSLWLCMDGVGAVMGVFFDVSSSRLYALCGAILWSLANGATPIPFYMISYTHYVTNLLMAQEYEYSERIYDMYTMTQTIADQATFPADPIGQRGLAAGIIVIWFFVLKFLTYVGLRWIARN